jgi:hypothetical protein
MGVSGGGRIKLSDEDVVGIGIKVEIGVRQLLRPSHFLSALARHISEVWQQLSQPSFSW